MATDSLKQYIDLYEANRAHIDHFSAPALNALRADALEALKHMHLPTRGDEGFEKTSINDMMAPDFGINFNRVNIPVQIAETFRCEVPRVSTLMAFVINDTFHPGTASPDRLPEGVTVMSLAEAALTMPDDVTRHYGKIAAPHTNAGVALNTLLCQDGVYVHIAKGVKLEKPLQIVNIFSAPVDLMAVRRVLIVLEEGAEARVLMCDHTQDDEHHYMSLQVIEAAISKGARLDIYDMEESSHLTSRYSQLYLRQDENSETVVNGTTLSNGTTRNDYRISLEGEHSQTLLGGMAVGSQHQHIDNDSSVEHLAPKCRSNQIFKYILDDEASGAFEGGITVHPGAILTEAYQSNRNLLASIGAKMHTKPQLLIYCDDVKCSHGATTGQLDQQALFYMRQRGISERTARTMLMEAFMTDVIDTVTIEGLRDRLRHLLDMRLHGQRSFCGHCRQHGDNPETQH